MRNWPKEEALPAFRPRPASAHPPFLPSHTRLSYLTQMIIKVSLFEPFILYALAVTLVSRWVVAFSFRFANNTEIFVLVDIKTFWGLCGHGGYGDNCGHGVFEIEV